jgi:cob(I)alamin adenosyltransferase
MKIYTKTGDDGTTGLFGGGRVRKASTRVEAYGTVDELNACLGLAATEALGPEILSALAVIQADLFTMGAELACVPGKEDKLRLRLLDESDVERLEKLIDDLDPRLPGLTTFVLPGGTRAAAVLHLARTVCRRAERAIHALDDTPTRPALVQYLNRLSDLLFVLARFANHEAGTPDVPWNPTRTGA